MSRKEYERLDNLAEQIIDAWREDRDADVSNLIDKGLDLSPKGLVYALARHAADRR